MATVSELVAGSTSLSINQGTAFTSGSIDYIVSRYISGSPDPEAETITETIEVLIGGTNATDLAANRSALMEMLYRIKRRQDNPALDRVYLHFLPDGLTGEYRSELIGYAITFEEGTYDESWDMLITMVAISITRMNYFESVTETELPLANTSGSGTGGRTVYNHWDAGANHVNYVTIAAADVTGDLPAPLRLVITNSRNENYGISAVWVGSNAYSDPANFTPVLEAEDATGGTDAADAACSGGYKSAYTLAADGDTNMFTFTLSAALLTKCAGNYFKVIMRFSAVAGNSEAWLHADIYYGGVVPLFVGAPVRFDTTRNYCIRELCVIQLPPWLNEIGNPAALTMRIYGNRVAAVSTTLTLDYIYLMPLESFARYEVNGWVPYQSAIVADGILGKVYSQNSDGSARQGDVVSYGSGVTVQPGKLQRLYFLREDTTSVLTVDVTSSIKAYYRPRRLAL